MTRASDAAMSEALYDAQEYLIAGLENQAEWWEHLGDAHRDYAKLAQLAVAQDEELRRLRGFPRDTSTTRTAPGVKATGASSSASTASGSPTHSASAAPAHFWTRRLTRWESIRLRCTWPYIRQTRLLNPLTEWWLNRG